MDPDSETTKKETFSRLLGSASSFAELVVRLERTVAWLRERKLHRERHRRLAYLLLSCRRMSAAESYGLRTPKKLRKFRGTARRAVLRAAPSPGPAPGRRDGRTRFATLMARYGSARRRSGPVGTRCSAAKDLFGIAAKWARKDKRIARIERSDDVDDAKAEDRPDAKAEENEIDNIFASIGV